MNWKEFLTGYKGKDIPKELNEFNWGAFILTFIWGIKHKAWITLLAIPLIYFQLPLGLNWILLIALQFYCGFRGNMWAYQVDWWMSPKDFRQNQMRWGAIAIILNISIPLFALIIAGRFVQKSPNNPVDFIGNTQCSVAYSKLKKFNKISLNSTMSDNEIAANFAKQFKNASNDGSRVNFTIKADSGKKIETYYIDFDTQPNQMCNILQQNCTITSTFILPAEMNIPNHCVFFFDMDKNIEPDEQTAKNLKKGANIFKYL